jgi:hypothetical protein
MTPIGPGYLCNRIPNYVTEHEESVGYWVQLSIPVETSVIPDQ